MNLFPYIPRSGIMLYSLIETSPYGEDVKIYHPHELCQLTKNTSEELLAYFNDKSQTSHNAMPLSLNASKQPLGRFFIHLDTKKP